MAMWLSRCLLALFLGLTGVAHGASAEPESDKDNAGKSAYLTLIIDDLGQNPERDRRALALPGPVTLAIMPDTPHATDFAREAHKAGKTVILHMPMDPATGPYAWRPDLPMDELAKRLNDALLKVPYAAGLNNHEGSRMTAQPEAMGWLVAELQRRHLFLIDSRTSAKTVAAAQAQLIGLASASRDVFLDDVRTPEAVATQLKTAIRLAHKQGSVIMIGHPYPVTLDLLERELPGLKAQGINWIDVRRMISVRGNGAMAAHGKNGVYHKTAAAHPAKPSEPKAAPVTPSAPATPTKPDAPPAPTTPAEPAIPDAPSTPAAAAPDAPAAPAAPAATEQEPPAEL